MFFVLTDCQTAIGSTQAAPGIVINSDSKKSGNYSIDLRKANSDDKAHLASSLPRLAKLTLLEKFGIHESGETTLTDSKFEIPAQFKIKRGVFVTFSKGKETRACWGSIEPHYANLVEATIATTKLALSSDYRHRAIRKNEISELKPQVTVIQRIVPIANLHGQDALRQGLMIRKGAKSAVILPGEASDPYYELVLCKLKAQIKPQENCQLYRIIANVYK